MDKFKPKAIICDIDGCVLDTSAIYKEIERLNLEGQRKWMFFETFANDSKMSVFNQTLGNWLVSQYIKGINIIFLTARSEKIRYNTRTRLNKEFKNVLDYCLLMRAKDDLDPAHIVKEKHLKTILERYEVILAIDDEQPNLDMFNRYGLLVKKV